MDFHVALLRNFISYFCQKGSPHMDEKKERKRCLMSAISEYQDQRRMEIRKEIVWKTRVTEKNTISALVLRMHSGQAITSYATTSDHCSPPLQL
jgi:hypothetical protein